VVSPGGPRGVKWSGIDHPGRNQAQPGRFDAGKGSTCCKQ